MVDKSLVTLGEITEETYNSIYDTLANDGLTLKFVNFVYNGTYGIFYKGIPVGLFKLEKWIGGNLTISMAIMDEYRGKGICPIATDLIVDVFGERYPNVERFIGNIRPNNENSMKAIQKTDWNETWEYNEMMMEEGSSYYNIYYRNNPYYKKEGGKTP